MSKHVLLTPVTGSFELGKLSIPIDAIAEISTTFPANRTTVKYVGPLQDIVSVVVAESAGTLATRINTILT